MTIIPAQKAIADLIDLAERGEIDPWDVPVISIIDRFLTELGLIDETQTPPQANLPQSGQTFLWASMLVLFKADSLHLTQTEPLEPEPEEFLETEIFSEVELVRSLPANLEEQIRRRTSVQSVGKRRVTLQELIEQLEHIAAEIEAAESNGTPKPSKRSRSAAIKAIAKLAHNENLTELAAQLERFLYSSLPEIAPDRDCVDWEQLLHFWQTQEQSTGNLEDHGLDRAGIFWALLLLSAQSKVELSQKEFYQDLSIRTLNWGN
ncbi:MAG: segregation/condensation protein A [Pleurocapsa sp.]